MIDHIPLAYPNFQKSVSCLSDGVLLQLLPTMHDCYRHLQARSEYDIPCNFFRVWRAWYYCRPAFLKFALMCYAEADDRNLSYNTRQRDNMAARDFKGPWAKPLWIGWDRLHQHHRSHLFHLGRCECAAFRICKYYVEEDDVCNARALRWLDRNAGYANFYRLQHQDVDDVNRRLDLEGFGGSCIPNHYDQFNWGVENTWRGEDFQIPRGVEDYAA